MSAFEELAATQYVSLETFRENGTGVKTPVWVAAVGAELVVFTLRDSYKVKRLKRNPAVRVAQCGMRGAIKGPWHEGEGRIVHDEAHDRAIYKALRKKYGLPMIFADWSGRLTGRAKKRVTLAIRLDE